MLEIYLIDKYIQVFIITFNIKRCQMKDTVYIDLKRLMFLS